MLLQNAEPDDPRTKVLEKIERQTFRAAKIVNGLLNLARPAQVDSGPIDLHAVINDVLALLEHQLKNSSIQVRKELRRARQDRAGHRVQLQQVFLNLFLNAGDAMPRGGWLTIATSMRDDGAAVVEVSDTGSGIPPDHLSRIYDPFFTTKDIGKGTGLGLSITYGIVQEHGGTMTCESAVEHGTRFTIALPAVSRGAPARLRKLAHDVKTRGHNESQRNDPGHRRRGDHARDPRDAADPGRHQVRLAANGGRGARPGPDDVVRRRHRRHDDAGHGRHLRAR